MASQMVRILDGNTFVVCDERGDIEASPTEPTGLFSFDTRYLSQWVMTVNGGRLNSLSDRRPPVLRVALLPRARAPARSTSTPSCRSSASERWATASTRS